MRYPNLRSVDEVIPFDISIKVKRFSGKRKQNMNVNSFSAGIDIRRQNLTPVDVRF